MDKSHRARRPELSQRLMLGCQGNAVLTGLAWEAEEEPPPGQDLSPPLKKEPTYPSLGLLCEEHISK